MAGSRELGTADIARRHGVDRKSAWRWLRALHEKYGDRVVTRRGRRGVYVTTEAAMAGVAPLAPSTEKDERRFRELEERIADAEKRADRAAADLSLVRRQVEQLAFGYQ